MDKDIEILAPVGGMPALEAAVRCGANAVYLGGAGLNARQGAGSFDKPLLKKAVAYCHARGVAVHQTLNTIVFDDELKLAEKLVKDATEAGVDAFIIQDLAVLELAKACAPQIELHASTQMAVHNLEGVKALEKLGFSRVVLARELALNEIAHITRNSPIEVECFVHGALCVSVSGQCYLSAMIGRRSGNRGCCAQPCRLPFSSGKRTHALSLKDLSVIEYLPKLYELGVSSFKIEGRLKRPEYVAAAVTACKEVLAGKTPDYQTLQSVFSRSGFTKGYVENRLGDDMFGTRTKEDVKVDTKTLKELAALYCNEQPLIGVNFKLVMKVNSPTVLIATSEGVTVEVLGEIPQSAISSPTNAQRAEKALKKTGGTPFYLENLICEIEEGLMLPASALNNLRRSALDSLLTERERSDVKRFIPYDWNKIEREINTTPKFRGQFKTASQIWQGAFEQLDEIVVPIEEGLTLVEHKEKVILELPHLTFSQTAWNKLEHQLKLGKKLGFTNVLIGGIDTIDLATSLQYNCYGDFNLNIVNQLAVTEYAKLGLNSVTMSIEYPTKTKEPFSSTEKGIVIYGSLPMMTLRNKPSGLSNNDKTLTDRLGNKFLVEDQGEVWVLYNTVPIYLADQLNDYAGFSFYTLYFSGEKKAECKRIFENYKQGKKYDKAFTRGLYRRKVK